MQNKVVIIGAGFVGSTIAYALMNNGIASEIVLIDIDEDKAEGEAMDLSHGASFVKPVNVSSGSYEECVDADMVIITAGANQKPGESRLDLVKKNTGIFKQIVPQITEYTEDTLLLVVTNPVDILTYVAYRISGYPRERVLGSGTVLDTSRFRYLLSWHCEVNPANIHAYIIGEHGDHEVAAWSQTNIAGINFDRFCLTCERDCGEEFRDEVYHKVKDAAYEVIDKKGATYYAIGLAVTRIVESIFRNENTILTVSSILDGHYGLSDMALSLPAKVGRSGIKDVLMMELSAEEEEALIESGELLKGIIAELDF
ncbi:MAG: L-lactate dehydrogenase [Halanaerobiales bacterium]